YSFLLPFILSCYGDHRDLLSFPTRRSSDLSCDIQCVVCGHNLSRRSFRKIVDRIRLYPIYRSITFYFDNEIFRCRIRVVKRGCRSEEHTSELQSRENLVCRLLLEKKKRYSY